MLDVLEKPFSSEARDFSSNLFERFLNSRVAENIGKKNSLMETGSPLMSLISYCLCPPIYSLWTWHGAKGREDPDPSLVMLVYVR